MIRLRGLLTFCASVVVSLNAALAAEPGTSAPIPLPQADRAVLERLLGPGVVGEALPGKPLLASSEFMPVADVTWVFRFTGGKQSGTTEEAVLTRMSRDKTGKSGRFAVGDDSVYYFRQSGDGDLYIISEHDQQEGMITRFTPSEPVILSGMAPGTTKRKQSTVKLFDLSDPKDLAHQGTVNLSYSYIGTYRVTVPAGTFDAVLIKWRYQGEVGPATVEDTQYRFFAEGMGPVAMVDKSNISAYLLYQDNSKQGRVLVRKE